MAYSIPTPSALKTAYPAFAGVADATVQLALDRHDEMVDDSWPTQARFTTGVLLYACHLLAGQGLGTGVDNSAERGGGDVKRLKAGDRELEFFSTAESGVASASTLGATFYGRELRGLLRRMFGGPRVF